MDPTNYWGQVDLTQMPSVTGPVQAYQAAQQQGVARTSSIAQAQRQMQQQAIGDAALKDALANPSAQTYQALAIARPEVFQSAKAAHDMLDTETQRSNVQNLGAVFGNLNAGQNDQAAALLKQYGDAAKRAGKDASSYDALQSLISTDPTKAKVLAGTMLSTLAGPDKFAEAYGKMGDEGRAQAAEPGKEALTAAQAAEANANAAKVTNPPPKTTVNPITGEYYNENAAPPAGPALGANNAALSDLVPKLIASEGGGNPTAKNPNSSATGAAQFLKGTWLPLMQQLHPELTQGKTEQQVLDLRNSPNLAAEATAAYAQQNAQALGSAGLPVNGATLAMAHKLGPGGAQAVLQADQGAKLSTVLPPDVIAANPQLANQTAGQYGQGLAAKFGTAAIDVTPGDPNATGDAFLKTLPAGRAALVKAIADGDRPGPTGRSAASGPGQILMQQVQQYDPTATAIDLPARQATRKSATSGVIAQSIIQGNTVGGHLAALDALVDTLHNGPVPLANSIAQGVETAAGIASKQRAVTSFKTLSNTLASELTKFYRSNGGSEADVNEFRKQLDVTGSPTQIHAAIQSMAGAVLSKIGALNDSYNAGMGRVSSGLNLPNINHNAIARLQKLAGDSAITFGGDAPVAQSTPQVATNAQGQRVIYDPASRQWKPG